MEADSLVCFHLAAQGVEHLPRLPQVPAQDLVVFPPPAIQPVAVLAEGDLAKHSLDLDPRGGKQ